MDYKEIEKNSELSTEKQIVSYSKDLSLRGYFNVKGEETVSGNFLYYVVGGSSLLILVGLIVYLIYRKNSQNEERRKNRENKEKEKDTSSKANKGGNTQNQEKNEENKQDNNAFKSPQTNIAGEAEIKDVSDDDDGEIKVAAKGSDLNGDSTHLSFDRSNIHLMSKKYSVISIPKTEVISNLNSASKNDKNSKNGEDQENDLRKEDKYNQRRESEQSHVSNLSAHKIVQRNGQKDLVCFTNEHRSEPDNDMFKDELPQAIVKEEEDKLSARDIISFDEDASSNMSDETSKKKVRFEKGIVDYKRESKLNSVGKKFSIKDKRRITDFDENTKDLINLIPVYKQDKMQRDTKTMVTDFSIQLSKPRITEEYSIKPQKVEEKEEEKSDNKIVGNSEEKKRRRVSNSRMIKS